jgi:hypothetical protein
MRNPLSRRQHDSSRAEPGSAEQAGNGHATQTPVAAPVGFSKYLQYLLGLGTWGFGGPIASVGYMQRDLVERRGWLTEAEFLDGVALGQTMPGPLAAQVVMWIGYLRKGGSAP